MNLCKYSGALHLKSFYRTLPYRYFGALHLKSFYHTLPYKYFGALHLKSFYRTLPYRYFGALHLKVFSTKNYFQVSADQSFIVRMQSSRAAKYL